MFKFHLFDFFEIQEEINKLNVTKTTIGDTPTNKSKKTSYLSSSIIIGLANPLLNQEFFR